MSELFNESSLNHISNRMSSDIMVAGLSQFVSKQAVVHLLAVKQLDKNEIIWRSVELRQGMCLFTVCLLSLQQQIPSFLNLFYFLP